jgi:hypothetical protein
MSSGRTGGKLTAVRDPAVAEQRPVVSFQPRRAVVTAPDSGMGRATAVALAAGMGIGITWHSDEAGAQDTAAEVRKADVTAEVAHLDTSALDTCGDATDELAARLGGVDAFVNRAGPGPPQWRLT